MIPWILIFITMALQPTTPRPHHDGKNPRLTFMAYQKYAIHKELITQKPWAYKRVAKVKSIHGRKFMVDNKKPIMAGLVVFSGLLIIAITYFTGSIEWGMCGVVPIIIGMPVQPTTLEDTGVYVVGRGADVTFNDTTFYNDIHTGLGAGYKSFYVLEGTWTFDNQVELDSGTEGNIQNVTITGSHDTVVKGAVGYSDYYMIFVVDMYHWTISNMSIDAELSTMGIEYQGYTHSNMFFAIKSGGAPGGYILSFHDGSASLALGCVLDGKSLFILRNVQGSSLVGCEFASASLGTNVQIVHGCASDSITGCNFRGAAGSIYIRGDSMPDGNYGLSITGNNFSDTYNKGQRIIFGHGDHQNIAITNNNFVGNIGTPSYGIINSTNTFTHDCENIVIENNNFGGYAATFKNYVDLDDAKILHTKTDVPREYVTNLGVYPIYADMVVNKYENNSGGAITIGECVVWDTANDNSVTVSNGGDDTLVQGMVYEASISDGEWGYILEKGHTNDSFLCVDGTDDIAVGDFLSTFTTNGIAQKGTVGGGTCFAIALEAYTTDDSNGTIKAILVDIR